MLELEAEITDKLTQAEALGENGDVDAMNQMMSAVEVLKAQKEQAEKAPIKSQIPREENGRGQKARELRVCDICGSFISILDNDQRLVDHFAGKLHIGYTIVRERIQLMDENRKTAGPPVRREERPVGRRESRDGDRSDRNERRRSDHNDDRGRRRDYRDDDSYRRRDRDHRDRSRDRRDYDRRRDRSPYRK